MSCGWCFVTSNTVPQMPREDLFSGLFSGDPSKRKYNSTVCTPGEEQGSEAFTRMLNSKVGFICSIAAGLIAQVFKTTSLHFHCPVHMLEVWRSRDPECVMSVLASCRCRCPHVMVSERFGIYRYLISILEFAFYRLCTILSLWLAIQEWTKSSQTGIPLPEDWFVCAIHLSFRTESLVAIHVPWQSWSPTPSYSFLTLWLISADVTQMHGKLLASKRYRWVGVDDGSIITPHLGKGNDKLDRSCAHPWCMVHWFQNTSFNTLCLVTCDAITFPAGVL